jgi:hypothetical protein
MSVIRCAQIDNQGVYIGMGEVEENSNDPRYIHSITECDLPPGKYEWIPDDNTFGGAFWPLASTVDELRPQPIRARKFRESRAEKAEREARQIKQRDRK